jgi:outer membrane protein insertion porin family
MQWPRRMRACLATRAILVLVVSFVVPLSTSLAQPATATAAQTHSTSSSAQTLCDQALPTPARLPPDGSAPVVYYLGLCFSAQGNVSLVDPATYLYYVKLKPSRPSQNDWVPFDDDTVAVIKDDFKRLWSTNFLDDLKIESSDYVFPNGVIGKIVTYHLEERSRIKNVSYEGSSQIDRSTLEEQLQKSGLQLRLDSFLDPATVRRVEGQIRQFLSEKGFVGAEVTHTIGALADSPKSVNLTFRINDGPKLVIRDVEFIGNRAVSDATLTHVLKDNRPQGLFSIFRGGDRYKESKFAEDAQRLEEFYRDRGYARASVANPEVRVLDDSPDGKTRWIQLRIPITEGEQYRIGSVAFDGNKLVTTDTLSRLFKLKAGELYSQKAIRDGLQEARDIYGAAGYMEFTGFPDVAPRDRPLAPGAVEPTPFSTEAADTANAETGPPTVDLTMRLTEGAQYFVNRITFFGNTTTRDGVIRRELQIFEGGVFNTEALKSSIRRLNQLGYFKPLEGNEKDLKVEKAAGRDNAVDVALTVTEQNRNQVSFGAGVSEYEGLFGSVSFTTSNFLGRGESLTLSGQKGVRATNYQLSFTEPYVFDRPISTGFDIYSRKVDYYTSANAVGYSEVRQGASVTFGRPLFRFSRAFLTYGYEVIDTAASDDFSLDQSGTIAGAPLFTALLDEGRHTESRLSPSIMHNTVDSPFMPHRGVRVTASLPVAGGILGGTSDYIRPELETVLYIPHTRRTALGLRANAAWIHPFGDTQALPYYLRFFLGGEYQIRGVGIRTVGPVDSDNRAIGGNKYALFNAEYYFDILGPVRALVFHDAGQAFQENHPIDLRQFRSSTGAELRFMVPMLNVPFRLIYFWNLNRDSFQPAHGFKFAVGTTF